MNGRWAGNQIKNRISSAEVRWGRSSGWHCPPLIPTTNGLPGDGDHASIGSGLSGVYQMDIPILLDPSCSLPTWSADHSEKQLLHTTCRILVQWFLFSANFLPARFSRRAPAASWISPYATGIRPDRLAPRRAYSADDDDYLYMQRSQSVLSRFTRPVPGFVLTIPVLFTAGG